MRTIVLVGLLAAACAPNPPPATYPPAHPAVETYRAIGTEPFWDIRIGGEMVFTDRGTGLTVVQPTPRPIHGFAGDIYQTARINVNINHVRCSDGMSDRTYPDTVQVTVDGRDYRGCGAASSWFDSIDERGQPRPPSTGDAVPLDRTRWRVLAVNGRPTPPAGDFSIDFENGGLSARLGCNSMSGAYVQAGSRLTVGALAATEMACPDMSFERQGGAILQGPLAIRLIEPNRIVLASSAGALDLERRQAAR